MLNLENKLLDSEPSQGQTNRLVFEKSPYLLQHAGNPVDWYPWGEDAFEKAKMENKPIFLSIGYSTCHWCHVMAHESFEDEEIANLMNEAFVSIKVDREERPDIDKIYMTVCQMLTNSGGWPLSIFMTPDKKPFFAGTYFPKTSRFGRIGFKELILQIRDLWNNKKGDLLSSAEQITLSLQNLSDESPGEIPSKSTIKRAYNQLAMQFDEKNGGFSLRPKFPTPHNLLLLLRFWKRTGTNHALEMVEKTLTSMRMGGIYDHIGFGFHRYSTDEHWLVPHFEKMLYDQALITIAYLEVYQATKNEFYANVAKEIIEYVLRDMTLPEGGFYSAEDADSEGVEGKFYVWTIVELKQFLADEDFELIKQFYNLNEIGNYLEEATQHKTGVNIFYQKFVTTKFAENKNIESSDLNKRLEAIRKELFEVREKRIHPHKDDKVLTDWNGLMIVALSKAYNLFSDTKYREAAISALNFILSKLTTDNNRLLHRYRDGNADINGYLDDYAFLVWGLIELYEATFEVEYLKLAIDLNAQMISHFWDTHIGGFFFSPDDGEELIKRQKEIYDGAIPSGNSIALLNLLRLSAITGNTKYEELADTSMRVFSEKIMANPLAYTQFLIAIDFSVGPTYSIVLSGNKDLKMNRELLALINNEYMPNKTQLYRDISNYPPEIDNYSNYIEWFDPVEGKTTVFVCINKTCKPPTSEPKKVLEYLKSEWK